MTRDLSGLVKCEVTCEPPLSIVGVDETGAEADVEIGGTVLLDPVRINIPVLVEAGLVKVLPAPAPPKKAAAPPAP